MDVANCRFGQHAFEGYRKHDRKNDQVADQCDPDSGKQNQYARWQQAEQFDALVTPTHVAEQITLAARNEVFGIGQLEFDLHVANQFLDEFKPSPDIKQKRWLFRFTRLDYFWLSS